MGENAQVRYSEVCVISEKDQMMKTKHGGTKYVRYSEGYTIVYVCDTEVKLYMNSGCYYNQFLYQKFLCGLFTEAFVPLAFFVCVFACAFFHRTEIGLANRPHNFSEMGRNIYKKASSHYQKTIPKLYISLFNYNVCTELPTSASF